MLAHVVAGGRRPPAGSPSSRWSRRLSSWIADRGRMIALGRRQDARRGERTGACASTSRRRRAPGPARATPALAQVAADLPESPQPGGERQPAFSPPVLVRLHDSAARRLSCSASRRVEPRRCSGPEKKAGRPRSAKPRNQSRWRCVAAPARRPPRRAAPGRSRGSSRAAGSAPRPARSARAATCRPAARAGRAPRSLDDRRRRADRLGRLEREAARRRPTAARSSARSGSVSRS